MAGGLDAARGWVERLKQSRERTRCFAEKEYTNWELGFGNRIWLLQTGGVRRRLRKGKSVGPLEALLEELKRN